MDNKITLDRTSRLFTANLNIANLQRSSYGWAVAAPKHHCQINRSNIVDIKNRILPKPNKFGAPNNSNGPVYRYGHSSPKYVSLSNPQSTNYRNIKMRLTQLSQSTTHYSTQIWNIHQSKYRCNFTCTISEPNHHSYLKRQNQNVYNRVATPQTMRPYLPIKSTIITAAYTYRNDIQKSQTPNACQICRFNIYYFVNLQKLLYSKLWMVI